MALTNKTKTRIFYISAIMFIVAFIWFARFTRHYLEADHEIANCFIDEIKTVGREQYVLVKYQFNVNGKAYKSSASFSQKIMSFENFKLLENKSVPAAYNLKYGKMLSYILIFPDDYKDFNVPFPDSLNWILPLMKK